MENSITFTKTGNLWFFHSIGIGIVYSYSTVDKVMTITCAHTGGIIDKFIATDEINSEEDFKKIINGLYINMISNGITLDLDYMDNPDIVGCIGVDFDLLKN